MQTNRLSKNFGEYSDSNFDVYQREIISSITDNDNFSQSEELFVDAKTFSPVFSSSLINAQNGSKELINIKNSNRILMQGKLGRICDWVTLVADSNKDILISSGIKLSKDKGSTVVVTNPQAQVKPGLNRGELDLSSKKVPGAKSYRFDYSEGPLTENSVWTTEVSTLSRYTFAGLKSGSMYYCRMAAIGSNNQVAYSAIVSSIVL